MNKYGWLDGFLLSMRGCNKDFKLEWGWYRYSVGGKLFAATCLPDEKYGVYGGRELLSLKCEPMRSEFLQSEYPDILPGFYMDKRNWISIFLGGDVPEDVMRDLVARSYSLVLGKLTKKLRREISEEKSE